MKQAILSVIVLLGCNLFCYAQVNEEPGGGAYNFNRQVSDEITPEQRAFIVEMLQKNEARLIAGGKLSLQSKTAFTAFQWPLKQAAGFADNGFYGISNYVDENPNYPNYVLDYNCGSRTYDQASGYNHAGTDIFTWPFSWQKMTQNEVEIIAAAPGIILGKSDGNYDQNCAFCSGSCNWNAVYVKHADGSVAWYGHMKSNSLTTKAVGQSVALGEFLGVVGSSGNSTGPHLHFEVYTNSSYTTLVDPWGGACNNHNGLTSWWANQQPYYVSTICKVMTHSAAPQIQSCPSGEQVNAKVNFVSGDNVIVGSYYRDQQAGQLATHTIYRPDNSVFTSWTQTFANTYTASYWYYTRTLPNPAPTGIWKYTIAYNSQIATAYFAVNTIMPLHLVSFDAVKKDGKVTLTFTTQNEESVSYFNVLKSANGSEYKSIGEIQAKNRTGNSYVVTDDKPCKTSFYKLEMVDKDGSKKYSSVRMVTFKEAGEYMSVAGNPFAQELKINVLQRVEKVDIELVNAAGQHMLVKRFGILPEGLLRLPAGQLPPGIYHIILRNKTSILEKITVIKQ